MHIIIQLNEHRLYIVTPLVAAVLENNREDITEITTKVTTEVNTEDTREVVLIVTDEAVEEVMDSVLFKTLVLREAIFKKSRLNSANV